MSTDYRLYCRDCDDQMEVWNIRDPSVLRDVWNKREAIAALDGLTDAIATESNPSDPLPVWFFVTHKGHNVVVRDEYGADFGSCVSRVKCKSCGERTRCGLAYGHAGDCAPVAPTHSADPPRSSSPPARSSP